MSRRSYVNDTRLYDDNNNNTTTINNNSNIMLDTCTDFHMCDGDDYDNNIRFQRSNVVVSTAVGMIIIYYNIKCTDYYSIMS